jgi:hypothetical protein
MTASWSRHNSVTTTPTFVTPWPTSATSTQRAGTGEVGFETRTQATSDRLDTKIDRSLHGKIVSYYAASTATNLDLSGG